MPRPRRRAGFARSALSLSNSMLVLAPATGASTDLRVIVAGWACAHLLAVATARHGRRTTIPIRTASHSRIASPLDFQTELRTRVTVPAGLAKRVRTRTGLPKQRSCWGIQIFVPAKRAGGHAPETEKGMRSIGPDAGHRTSAPTLPGARESLCSFPRRKTRRQPALQRVCPRRAEGLFGLNSCLAAAAECRT